MNFLNKHNLKAAGVHFIVCAAIALCTVGLVYGLWYPSPLNTALGVGKIFLLLLAIDIALGPLLTLVVYKPNKSSLKFDLTVIACVQLAALAYGLHTVGAARPAYMVFTNDRFDLVQAYEVADIAGSAEKPELSMQSHWVQPLWGYQLKSATVPRDVASGRVVELLTHSALSGGPDVPNVPAFRAEYAAALPRIQAAALPLSHFKTTAASTNTIAATLQAKYPVGSAALPLKIKYTIYTVVINPSTGAVLGIEPVDVF